MTFEHCKNVSPSRWSRSTYVATNSGQLMQSMPAKPFYRRSPSLGGSDPSPQSLGSLRRSLEPRISSRASTPSTSPFRGRINPPISHGRTRIRVSSRKSSHTRLPTLSGLSLINQPHVLCYQTLRGLDSDASRDSATLPLEDPTTVD